MTHDALVAPPSQATQVMLRLHYQDLARRGQPMPAFSDVEFRAFSQNSEDGILLLLFSVLGAPTRRAVEVCAGDGVECNAANLIVNHGWQGLLFDGDPANVATGQAFYAGCRTTWVSPPAMVQSWITAESIDGLVVSRGFGGEIDLLSVDIDGNDFWIWKALTSVDPRVVVVEFNAQCGPDTRVTMGYDAQYRSDYSVTPYRFGASLGAFTALAESRGYRLVGLQSLGFNAFFVKNGIGDELFPARTPRECYEAIPRLRPLLGHHVTPATPGWERWVEI